MIKTGKEIMEGMMIDHDLDQYIIPAIDSNLREILEICKPIADNLSDTLFSYSGDLEILYKKIDVKPFKDMVTQLEKEVGK